MLAAGVCVGGRTSVWSWEANGVGSHCVKYTQPAIIRQPHRNIQRQSVICVDGTVYIMICTSALLFCCVACSGGDGSGVLAYPTPLLPDRYPHENRGNGGSAMNIHIQHTVPVPLHLQYLALDPPATFPNCREFHSIPAARLCSASSDRISPSSSPPPLSSPSLPLPLLSTDPLRRPSFGPCAAARAPAEAPIWRIAPRRCGGAAALLPALAHSCHHRHSSVYCGVLPHSSPLSLSPLYSSLSLYCLSTATDLGYDCFELALTLARYSTLWDAGTLAQPTTWIGSCTVYSSSEPTHAVAYTL